MTPSDPTTSMPVTAGDPTTTSVGTTRAGDTTTSAGTGTVAVGLEPIDGFFIEGFEIALRFETVDGRVIATALWSEFVRSQGDRSIEAYYESVLEQPVPAGQVVVLAAVSIGLGPPPVVPDPGGDLPCRLVASVPQGDRVEVQVSFAAEGPCLRQVDPVRD